MRVHESSTSGPVSSWPASRDSLLRAPCVLLAMLGVFVVGIAQSNADDARVRGDLPPVASTTPTAELEALTAAQAKALFEEIHALLSQRVDGDAAKTRALYLGAIQGMLDQVNTEHMARSSARSAALPPPGMLLSSTQAQRIRQALAGQVTGIGIEFQLHSERGVLVVSRVLPGSPAESAGLLADDQILAIDGQTFFGSSLADVLSLLQGLEGSTVHFEFVRSGVTGPARYMMSLERGEFRVESTEARLEKNDVGYLRLHQLHQRSPSEVQTRLTELADQGARRFVLDLRGCVGGDLEAARALADLFLGPETVIAHIEEPGLGNEDLLANTPQQFDQSLAILIDGWTRGTAELLAASLQEQDRAFLIGQPTMGRAAGETLVELGHSLVLRIQSVRVAGPMGKSWHEEGVQPDQPIWATSQGSRPLPGSTGDLQYQTAVQYLVHETPKRAQ